MMKLLFAEAHVFDIHSTLEIVETESITVEPAAH